ncbi:MAG: hypothetical protein CM1200mP41_24320 [Gammaproteobacteria bacterium]|nr:MAG: hypothetical protein CM1200mP41_24320 [Gammaproteobacteria bacterium]
MTVAVWRRERPIDSEKRFQFTKKAGSVIAMSFSAYALSADQTIEQRPSASGRNAMDLLAETVDVRCHHGVPALSRWRPVRSDRKTFH